MDRWADGRIDGQANSCSMLPNHPSPAALLGASYITGQSSIPFLWASSLQLNLSLSLYIYISLSQWRIWCQVYLSPPAEIMVHYPITIKFLLDEMLASQWSRYNDSVQWLYEITTACHQQCCLNKMVVIFQMASSKAFCLKKFVLFSLNYDSDCATDKKSTMV